MGDGQERQAVIDALRGAGLRVTSPRVAVLNAVGRLPHATAGAVADRARVAVGSVSTQGVYDVLDALTVAQLVRRIQPAGSPARYETRTGDNHHHLVCRGCGTVTDVDCAQGSAPCLQPAPSPAPGFVVDEAELVFWGYCASCAPPDSRSKDT